MGRLGYDRGDFVEMSELVPDSIGVSAVVERADLDTHPIMTGIYPPKELPSGFRRVNIESLLFQMMNRARMERRTVYAMGGEGERGGRKPGRKKADEIRAALEGLGMSKGHLIFDAQGRYSHWLYEWEGGAAAVVRSAGTTYEYMNISVCGFDKTEVDDVWGKLRRFLPKKPKQKPVGELNMLVATASGISIQSVGKCVTPLERGNYSDEVLAAYDEIRAALTVKNPVGRLSVVDGPPGTGKTFFMRGLITETPDANFLLVHSGVVSQLAGPNIIMTLVGASSEGKPLVLVIEDADELLVNRAHGDMSGISALLNLSDGIIGGMLDLRVVCTTNAKRIELDPAVVRSGRLVQHLHLGELTKEHAQRVYERLGGDSLGAIDGPMTLADVYRLAAAGDVLGEPKRRRVGF